MFHIFSFWVLAWGLGISLFAQGIDIRVLRSLNPDRPTRADKALLYLTHSMKPVCLAVPAGLVSTGLATQNRAMLRAGLVNGASLLLTTGATFALKNTTKRPRPYVTYPDLRNLVTEKSWSFPSGHSAAAFSMATALTLSYPRWYIGLPAFGWAGAVAYSRLHLGAHYPSDVLIGIGSGVGYALLTHWLSKKW